MANDDWMSFFSEIVAEFLLEGLFDHTPCVTSLHRHQHRVKTSFKFFDMWIVSSDFLKTVQTYWDKQCYGTHMFRVAYKLKRLKIGLKQLNRNGFSKIEQKTEIAKQYLLSIQRKCNLLPLDMDLRSLEKQAAQATRILHNANWQFLQQKAKTHWLQEGDGNTSYFHSSIRARRVQNRVYQILDSQGQLCTDGKQIEQAFLDYFK
ncbi:hypothetical protein vseg_016161 [Gypsophila vaccaria]